MRFRRVSFPFSAAMSRPDGRAVPDGRPELRHRLQGRHADRAAGAAPARPTSHAVRTTANAFGFGEAEVQEFGNAGRSVAALPAAVRRRGGAERGRAEGARRLRARVRVPPRRDRRSARLGRARAVRHHRRHPLGARGAALSLVPLRARARHRGDRRHAARHRADDRLLRRHPDRVQHDLDRRDPDHRRLFAERDRRGLRPHARAAAPLQGDAGRGAPRPVDQLDDVAHGDDRDDRLPVAPRARALRRLGDRGLRPRDAVRRRRLHLFGDLHLLAGADLHRRDRPGGGAGARTSGCRSRRSSDALAGRIYDGLRPGPASDRRLRRRRLPLRRRCRTAARSWRCPPASMPGSRRRAAEFSVEAFAPVLAEAAAIDVLLIGTGLDAGAVAGGAALAPQGRRHRRRRDADRRRGPHLQHPRSPRTARSRRRSWRCRDRAAACVERSLMVLRPLRSARPGRRPRPLLRRPVRAGRQAPVPVRALRLQPRDRPHPRQRLANPPSARSGCNGGATRCRARRAATSAAIPSPPPSTTRSCASGCPGRPSSTSSTPAPSTSTTTRCRRSPISRAMPARPPRP